jgi:hypothetical protein
MRSLAAITLGTFVLLGCVVYPTQRTYFEPNAMDGIPTPSQSCGYNTAKNDALVREVDGVLVQVSPHLDEGKPFSVTVMFQATSTVELSPDRYELRSVTSGMTFLPVSQKINTYKPDRTHPYYSSWLTLQFQPMPEQLNEISIIFPTGSVSINGQTVELVPFRFNKTTKSDIYYGSINC